MKRLRYRLDAGRITAGLCILAATTSLQNCSDKLTEEKAKTSLEDCAKKYSRDFTTTYPLDTGDNLVVRHKPDYLANLKKLDELGVVKYEHVNTEYGFTTYNLHLTEKGKKYVLSSEQKSDRTVYKIKLDEMKVGRIVSVYEDPSTNTGEARAVIEKINATPFRILKSDTTRTFEKDFTFVKTNHGWSGCR